MCACAVSDVHDVGVVVVTDEQWGEVGLAAVVAEPAAVVTLDSFDAFAAQRLARHKLPKRLVLVDAAHIDRP
ncbi:AMP-binding enzyme [Mycobacterium palustre]